MCTSAELPLCQLSGPRSWVRGAMFFVPWMPLPAWGSPFIVSEQMSEWNIWSGSRRINLMNNFQFPVSHQNRRVRKILLGRSCEIVFWRQCGDLSAPDNTSSRHGPCWAVLTTPSINRVTHWEYLAGPKPWANDPHYTALSRSPGTSCFLVMWK